MKAYLVTEPEENTGGVIFARSNIEARRRGAEEWNGGELGGMSVHRAARFDEYHGVGVPARLLVEEGWHFECSGCGMRIEDYTLEDAGLSVAGVVGNESSMVFCCAACEQRHRERKAREEAAGAAFLDAMKQRVRSRFGDVVFCDGTFREHVYCREIDGLMHVGQAVVSFEFPGMKIGPASLRYVWGYRQIGPVFPEYSCCRGDLEVFEAWAAGVRTDTFERNRKAACRRRDRKAAGMLL